MDKAALIIYLLILILSPLLFGAVHTYAYTIVTLGVLVAALLLLAKNIKKKAATGAYYFQRPRTDMTLPFFLLMGVLVLQVIPLPGWVLVLVSPEAKVVGEKAMPALPVVADRGLVEAWLTLAPYTYPVRMSIVRLMVYGLFFLGLIQVLNSQKRIEATLGVILAVGCFEALYGLIQAYSGEPHIWWFVKTDYKDDVTGTFINRNHLAGFMAMGLLLAAAYAAALGLRKKNRMAVSTEKTNFRRRVLQFVLGEQRFNKRALILFAGVVIGIGLVFSASRGGMLGAAAGMLCMSLLFLWRKAYRRKGFVLLLLFLVTAVYALHIGAEYPLGRFNFFWRNFEERSQLAERTLAMFGDYRLTGVGVGNFQYAYPKYQLAERKDQFVRHAHNDWAQFLSEAGIAGLAALLVGMAYYLSGTLRLWKKRSDPFAVCFGVAPLAVMAAMATHSVSDFNLHVPANFLMLVAVMAIGYSALHLERHRGGDKAFLRYHVMPLRYRGLLAMVLLFGVISWSGVWTIRHFVAEAYCNTVHNSTLNRDQAPPLEEIRQAIAWDSWNAEYRYKMAKEMMRLRDSGAWSVEHGAWGMVHGAEAWSTGVSGDSGIEGFTRHALPVSKQADMNPPLLQRGDRGDLEAGDSGIGGFDRQQLTTDNGQRTSQHQCQLEIVKALEQAVRLNPFCAQYHLRLAWEYSPLWDYSDDQEEWMAAADLSADRAAYFAGEKNPEYHLNIANYWVKRSRTIGPAESGWLVAWEKASWHFRKYEILRDL